MQPRVAVRATLPETGPQCACGQLNPAVLTRLLGNTGQDAPSSCCVRASPFVAYRYCHVRRHRRPIRAIEGIVGAVRDPRTRRAIEGAVIASSCGALQSVRADHTGSFRLGGGTWRRVRVT